MRYLYPAHPDEDLSPSASPAIVEAVPRDHVVPSEEYRDELYKNRSSRKTDSQ